MQFMNRSEYELLTDVLIGEAVLSLLHENGPISTQALIVRLQVMEAKETDPERRAALATVIADISSNKMATKRRSAAERTDWDRDRQKKGNVYPLFGENQRSDSKKH